MKSELGMDGLGTVLCEDTKMLDHKISSSDSKISDIIDGVSDDQKEYQKKLIAQKDSIVLLYDIYNTLSVSIKYLENTRAIVERLRFYTAREKQENPIPPGVTIVNEHENAIMYIKNNLIEF
jgi:hypothetical protein